MPLVAYPYGPKTMWVQVPYGPRAQAGSGAHMGSRIPGPTCPRIQNGPRAQMGPEPAGVPGPYDEPWAHTGPVPRWARV